MDCILESIKKLLGITEEYDHFDNDIMMHINSVFVILNQLGVGKEGFCLESGDELWTDFEPNVGLIAFIKSYVYLKVKLLFDPPTSPGVFAAVERQIAELEWRINVAVDPKAETTE